MNRLFTRCTPVLFCLLFTLSLYAQSTEEKVAALLDQMTLQEKIGQMTQFSIDVISVGDPYNLDEPHTIDRAKLKKAIIDYGAGSILNVGGHSYSVDHWYEIHRLIDSAAQTSRLKVPVLYGIDAVHGHNYALGATLFPQQIGMAATWNPALVEKGGSVCAYETRASGIPWNFSPILDVMRQPLWSRCFETFGEDPYLVQEMGRAIIQGYEGEDIANRYRVSACMKHFLGYSYPFTGKDRTPAYIPDWMLQEIFVPPFKAAIDAGVQTIMINSGEINGTPVHMNKKILTDLLRDELGFEGFAVSDWEDIILLHSRHKVAATIKEAVGMAVNAGIDMSMVPMDYNFPDYLLELVQEGVVSEARIDEAARRILTVKYNLGLFDYPYYAKEEYPKYGSVEHAEIARQAALESLTLLKNKGNTLPIEKRKAKVFVTGPAAHSLNMLNGGWTHTWQGTDPQYNRSDKVTIYEAISQEIGASQVSYTQGSELDAVGDLTESLKLARAADYIVVCLGEKPSTEKPGDIEDLNLPAAQQTLFKELAATGKPIVLVMVEGRPRIIRELVELADAVLMCYLPGDEGGVAVAEVLFGDHNPEGKLPYTYPRYANSLTTYDHKYTERIDPYFGHNAINPQFEFGFGLSYTSFEYSNLSLSSDVLGENESLTVSVQVQNTGKRMGREVVQLFVSDHYASMTPPAKRLKGFRKITLLPGESREISFNLKPADLAFWSADGTWITEAGTFSVLIGGEEATFNYETE